MIGSLSLKTYIAGQQTSASASARRKRRKVAAAAAAVAVAVAVARLQRMMVLIQLVLEREMERGGQHPSANPIMNHRHPALLLRPKQRLVVRRTFKLLLLLVLPNQRLRTLKLLLLLPNQRLLVRRKLRGESASRVAFAKREPHLFQNLMMLNLRNPELLMATLRSLRNPVMLPSVLMNGAYQQHRLQSRSLRRVAFVKCSCPRVSPSWSLDRVSVSLSYISAIVEYIFVYKYNIFLKCTGDFTYKGNCPNYI